MIKRWEYRFDEWVINNDVEWINNKLRIIDIVDWFNEWVVIIFKFKKEKVGMNWDENDEQKMMFWVDIVINFW